MHFAKSKWFLITGTLAVIFLIWMGSEYFFISPKEEVQGPLDGGKPWSVSGKINITAKLAWKGNVYTIEGNRTPFDKIGEKLGSIQRLVEDIEKNGDGKLLDDKVNLTPGTKIYGIKGVTDETVVAVKINNTYYTAIFAHRLD